MIKRIFSAMLAVSLILSLTACGEEKTVNEADKSESATTTTVNSKENDTSKTEFTTTGTWLGTTNALASDSEKTDETTEEASEEIPLIDNCIFFDNGFMAFEANNHQEGYIYNIAENKLYDCGENSLLDLKAVCGNIAVLGDMYACLLNFETGETIASAKKDSIRPTNARTGVITDPVNVRDYDRIYAVKADEAISGTTYSFGIFDEEGEWLLPLSDEYALCEYLGEYSFMSGADLPYVAMQKQSDTVKGLACCIYFTEDDKIIDITEKTGFNYIFGAYEDSVLLCNADNWGSWSDLSSYDIKTGKITPVVEGEFNLDQVLTGVASIIIDSSDRRYYINGIKSDVVYELSKYDEDYYNFIGVYNADENIIVLGVLNEKNDEYMVILDKDGNEIIEPLKGRAGLVYIEENKVISTGELGFILDCGTSEMIKKADSGYKIKEYDNNSGMMLVQSDGAYYLADISDPDTLINPFETAE